MPAAPELIAFSELKNDGRYPVRDVDGRLLAEFATQTFSRRFTASAADGSPLCAGRARRLLRRYDVTDGAGRPLLTLRTSVRSSRRRTARLADGRRLSLRSAGWPNPTWTVSDGSGHEGLVVEPARGRWSLHAEDVVARVDDPTWDLALVVALVVGNRMEAQASRVSDLLG